MDSVAICKYLLPYLYGSHHRYVGHASHTGNVGTLHVVLMSETRSVRLGSVSFELCGMNGSGRSTRIRFND